MQAEYSVLMSVYAKEKGSNLQESIESVMNQTIPPSDFVLVCDGPLTPELDKVIDQLTKKHPIINVIRLEKNVGLGDALAHGINFTKYELVMRMDSDDICLPYRAEVQLPIMEENDLVGGYVSEFVGTQDNIIATRAVKLTSKEIYSFAKKRSPFNHPSVMYKKSVVLAAGNYKKLLYFEDYYLWVRILQITKKVCNVDKVLVNMRSGNEMIKRRSTKEARHSVAFLRKYMLKIKMITWPEYLYIKWGHIFFLISPFFIKKIFYRTVLRK